MMANFTRYILLEFEKIFKTAVRAASEYSRNKVITFVNFPRLASLVQRQNIQKQPYAAVFQNRFS